jgi:endonuclease/exonuclease/phosphatase family metal-dependent hydrolase
LPVPSANLLDTLADGILLLFLFQSLMGLITSVYAFGLAASGLPLEAAGAFFVFSPALLWLFPSRLPRLTAPALATVGFGSRVVFPFLGPGLQVIVSGIAVGALLLLLALLIVDTKERFLSNLGASLATAFAGLAVLQVVGAGTDFSTHGLGQVVAWTLAISGLGVLVMRRIELTSDPLDAGPPKGVVVPATGLTSCLMLALTVYSAPSVVSRWAGVSYDLIVVCFFAGLMLYALLFVRGFPWLRDTRLMLVAQAALAACVLLTVFPQQVGFPSNLEAYPLVAHRLPSWQTLPAFGVMLMAPVTIHGSALFAQQIAALRPSLRRLALGFTAGALIFVVLVGAQVLTTTYDYVPVIGPLLRDRFWLVIFVTSLAPIAAMLGQRANVLGRVRCSQSVFILLAGMALIAFAGLATDGSSPSASPGASAALRVVTFNIQQGFAEDGGFGLPSQLDVLRGLRPDILGLQESDANRLTSGNVDAVRYFANRLGMYSYYGASPVVGTFGVALLSKYPIEDAKTFFLWSEGEQTACITARIKVGDKTLNVLVTHLGNGGPRAQLEQVLEIAAQFDHAVLLGDFNFRPSTQQYERATSQLVDSWLASWPTGLDDAGEGRGSAIDYIFVSSGVGVTSARYVNSSASDHPAYKAVIEP